jgi:hypothetical protein
MSETTKQCPFCAETIQSAAVVCRFCGRELVEKPAPHKTRNGGAYQCSVCKGYVRPEAIQCKHCHAVFPGESERPAPPPPKPLPLWQKILVGVACVVLAIGFGASFFIGRAPPAPRQPDRVSAWVDCRSFVEQNLKSPASAAFPISNDPGVTIAKLSNGRWSVLGFVDAENSFGAKIRQDFGCQISYAGERVTLHQLRIGDQVLLEE